MMRGKGVPSTWPRVWYGNVGGTSSTPHEHFTNRVSEFVSAAVQDFQDVEFGEHRSVDWPRWRLAINLVGSGAGGAFRRRGDLVERLLQTSTDLVNDPTFETTKGIDIVIVLNGGVAFAAAQRARRQMVADSSAEKIWQFASPEDHAVVLRKKAKRLADHARARHLVQFVGAGASAAAGVPLWKGLLEQVGRNLDIDSGELKELVEQDLRDAASLLEVIAGSRSDGADGRGESTPGLKASVERILEGHERYAVLHGLLASLPSYEVVTTNFDTHLEDAATTADRRVAVLPESPREADGRWLLKLHGSVTDPQNMVLTRSDFLNMPRQHGALMGLVQAMLLMRHMMFIGYSLTDEDFHEVLHEVRLARAGNAKDGKPFSGREYGTLLTLFEKRLQSDLWRGELDIVPILPEPEDAERVPIAARDLEVFLDLVVHLATTNAPYLFDPTYAELLTDEDQELKGQLEGLADSLHQDMAGRELVVEFLKQFGWQDSREVASG